MVSLVPVNKRRSSSIALFYAGKSLAKQVAEWGRLRPNVDIQLVSSTLSTTLRVLTPEAAAIVIDATEHPGAAMQTLANVLAVMQSVETELKLGVYTEKMYEGLELFVRRRGILFLLGPMDPAEWDAFFEGVVTE